MGNVGRYLHTVMRMKPSMVVSRLKRTKRLDPSTLAAQGKTLRKDAHILMLPTDLAEGYLKRFDVDALVKGEVALLNERYLIDFSRWQVPEASHLWNFNLHYFEYCIPLGAKWRESGDAVYWDCFKRFASSWMDVCTYGEGDAWHPYTVSLRLVNWLVCRDLFTDALSEDSEFDRAMQSSMYLQYRHLLANQEKHLLANHYFENLKTILIMSKMFGEDEVFEATWRSFEGQLREQILPDGVHFERSLMYHKLILEGIMRVALILRQTDAEAPVVLLEKMQAMLDALCSLERGMGKTPFFNDSADGVAKECVQIAGACREIFGLEGDGSIVTFPDAGYYKLYDEPYGIALMVDAGMPGPSYMLGHAHCDALSYEVSVRDVPVIANCGTYAYQSELRPYFRGTAAHNTAQCGDTEQLECWAEHRVAKGYRDVKVTSLDEKSISMVLVCEDGMSVSRTLRLENGVLTVADAAPGSKELVSHVHFVGGVDWGRRLVTDYAACTSNAVYSPEFGKTEDAVQVDVSSRDHVLYGVDLLGACMQSDIQ